MVAVFGGVGVLIAGPDHQESEWGLSTHPGDGDSLGGGVSDIVVVGAARRGLAAYLPGPTQTLDRARGGFVFVVHRLLHGLPCPALLQTMRIEAGAADGTAQGKVKRITRATIRFLYTLGGKAGKDEATADRIEFRTGSDRMDSAPPIFSGDKEVPWPAGYETEGRIMIIQDQPLPMTVAAIMPQVNTSDR